MRLEALTPGATVRGLLADRLTSVVSVQWYGSDVLEVTFKAPSGDLGSQLLFRDDEARLELAAAGRPWSFDGDGALLRLASEAYRIRLAHLFDPLLAVHTSDVEPLPHQITAVYDVMLPRQPLRFLLADDPGAGKTIMTGLYIRELALRGDLRRCLIVCPGNLVEQWQEELGRRFQLDFAVLRREHFADGNPFPDTHLCIARLDYLARNEEAQAKLAQTDWDLIVCDEAHKMSAVSSGSEVRETKRYKLGTLLSRCCRHFLLLTATPHNGKEEDFQRFMALIDPDRFEGRQHDDGRPADSADLMRRLVKEQLLKFDGTPLFPERRAYSVTYALSDLEAHLYAEVTAYVRLEMDRADRLALTGEERRRVTVGFALTTLQRRLASSPEAIYVSLRRRRERLEHRLREESRQPPAARPADPAAPLHTIREESLPYLSAEDLEDLDEAPESEVEQLEESVADRATAARTVAELRLELATLRRLEALALRVRDNGADRKWEELSNLLQGNREMFDTQGRRRKLIVFTEHRDTLHYLRQRVAGLIGRPEAIEVIHGSLGKEARRAAQERFLQDPTVELLLATDAAGEGVNLQRAHLMVNYDLPWNPNRLEQRFGRIHRIGQTEVCHLWNLVAPETREGEVFQRLFGKLERERQSLGGQVFDVLGKVFGERPLRELLIEAIRYGDQPAVRARLAQVVDGAVDHDHLRALLEERALARDSMDYRQVLAIKEAMERAEARRLQPHFIAAFFLEAFRRLGGTAQERERQRYEVTHVPALLRQGGRTAGPHPAPARYERITFDKALTVVAGKPPAAFICPGHPLLDAVVDLTLERHRELLQRGAVLVDPTDQSREARLLVYLEHAIVDGIPTVDGGQRIISKRLEFVELLAGGGARAAGYAPYLDYRPLDDAECAALDVPATGDAVRPWPLAESAAELEGRAAGYAIRELIPGHLRAVREAREDLIQRTLAAVKERLTREIMYWDHRAEDLEEQERAGRQPKMNAALARRRADDLAARLQRRVQELAAERQLAALPPVVIGAALILPAGALPACEGPAMEQAAPLSPPSAEARREVERLAMAAVMATERRLGRSARDVSAANCGYDVESRTADGRLLFIEVKGRQAAAETVTITKNEILTALNAPDRFILALVPVDGAAQPLRYLRLPFAVAPDFGVTSVNYDFADLLARAEAPA